MEYDRLRWVSGLRLMLLLLLVLNPAHANAEGICVNEKALPEPTQRLIQRTFGDLDIFLRRDWGPAPVGYVTHFVGAGLTDYMTPAFTLVFGGYVATHLFPFHDGPDGVETLVAGGAFDEVSDEGEALVHALFFVLVEDGLVVGSEHSYASAVSAIRALLAEPHDTTDEFRPIDTCHIERDRLGTKLGATYASVDVSASEEEKARCVITSILLSFGFSGANDIFHSAIIIKKGNTAVIPDAQIRPAPSGLLSAVNNLKGQLTYDPRRPLGLVAVGASRCTAVNYIFDSTHNQ